MWDNFHTHTIVLYNRWQLQSRDQHIQHEQRVAYRGMLEAVISGNDIPRKALRKLKMDSIEEYAKAVAINLNGEF